MEAEFRPDSWLLVIGSAGSVAVSPWTLLVLLASPGRSEPPSGSSFSTAFCGASADPVCTPVAGPR